MSLISKHLATHFLITKVISVQSCFADIFEEKLKKNNRISLTLAGSPISGLTGTGYPTLSIRPDTGQEKRPDFPAGYPAGRIIRASLILVS
jgi:hypothetical protein